MKAARSPWVLGARSETGYVRTANEDRMAWTRTAFGDLFLVSDGMGGYRGGALAAEIAVQVLQERIALIPADSERFSDLIRQAFQTANREVFNRRVADDPETCDMGATGVALITDGRRVIAANVGDSRAYLWRRSSGLRRLTRDHSRVQTLLEAGLLTVEQAANHAEASVLDRAIGHQASVEVDVSDWIPLLPGDMLMLCSDGLCGYVSDDEIGIILSARRTPQEITDALIERALDKGGYDNITVQLLRYAPGRLGMFGRRLSWNSPLWPVGLGVVAIVALGALVYERRELEDLRTQLAQGKPAASRPLRPDATASAAASAVPAAHKASPLDHPP